MEQNQETVREIVLTSAVLHNILRSQYNGQHGGQQPEDDEVVGDSQLVGDDGDGGHDKSPHDNKKEKNVKCLYPNC